MRIWKIVSGVLSIAISAFVVFQSFFAGLFNILTSNGQSSGTAGVIVAILLLAGGIVSIAASGGSMAADIALICLYGLASLVGFTMSGSYADLLIWALWCLICAVLAVVDFFLSYWDDDGAETAYREEDAAPASAVPSLRAVILERNPKKRNAVIDGLPEREAKGYLKQVVAAFINREPIMPPGMEDDERDGPTGRTVVVAVVCTAVICVAGFIIFSTWRSLDGGQAQGDGPSQAVTSQEPSQRPSLAPPSAEPSPSAAPPSGSAGTLGDYDVEILGAFIADDFDGNPALIVTYSWTNNSDRTISAMTALSEKAFQNGVQIDRAVVYSRDTPGYESSSSSRDVRPGATSEAQCAFSLRDLTSTVEFEVSEFASLSGEVLSMDFAPGELNTVG